MAKGKKAGSAKVGRIIAAQPPAAVTAVAPNSMGLASAPISPPANIPPPPGVKQGYKKGGKVSDEKTEGKAEKKAERANPMLEKNEGKYAKGGVVASNAIAPNTTNNVGKVNRHGTDRTQFGPVISAKSELNKAAPNPDNVLPKNPPKVSMNKPGGTQAAAAMPFKDDINKSYGQAVSTPAVPGKFSINTGDESVAGKNSPLRGAMAKRTTPGSLPRPRR